MKDRDARTSALNGLRSEGSNHDLEMICVSGSRNLGRLVGGGSNSGRSVFRESDNKGLGSRWFSRFQN